MPAPAAIRANARREMPVIGTEYPSRSARHSAVSGQPRVGIANEMARGDHPRRTPFYDVRVLSCRLASSIHILWLCIAIYVLAAVAAVIGFVMTFRDYSF
jgi:hypothetical protein